jgi:hypothetical protein
MRLFGIVALFGLVILSAASVRAQDETIRSVAGDKYVISAKAGGVNLVEGNVGIVRKAGRNGLLLKGDTLKVGDRVSTGADGRAEILLNPGSYLRLGGNSAFEFVTTSLEDLELRLDSGSAILEVFADNDFRVTLKSPKSNFNLVESGVYRLDVSADGGGRLEVWKGEAEVGGTTVKGGRAVTASGTQVEVAKFDRDEKDDLELWSKSRAKDLAKSMSYLRNRDMRTALMRSYLGGRWNMYNSFGLWVYNARFGGYCFLPFGYGWGSPYGYGFGHSLWWYNLPSTVYTWNPNTGGSGTGSGGGNSGTQITPIRSQGDRSPVPPFTRMQGGSSTGPEMVRGGNGRRGTADVDSGPIFAPSGPTYSPPAKVDVPVSIPSPKGKGGN